MKIKVHHNQMEEVEGLYNAYPYTYHHVDLNRTLIPWHWHEALEFDYVAEGSVKVSTTTQTYTFQKNQGFFINSNVLTTMVREQNCVLDSHLFHPVFLGGHFKSVFETKYLHPVTQNRHVELIPLLGQTEQQRQILGKLRQLTLLQSRPDTEFQTRNLLSEIWLLLLEEVKNQNTRDTGASSRNQDRILTMMAYIHDNYREKLTLEEIADSAAISTRECLRCFQTSIRQSPMDYLITYRLGVAKKLLETTALPVTEVALRSGFNSPAYFSKMFRQYTGKTPVAYRKELAELEKKGL